MKNTILALVVTTTFLLLQAAHVFAHCEVPCGIYDDKMRISMLNEHITTIEKSIAKAAEFEQKGNSNQMVRWIMSKEDHANQFQHIVSQYFLTQRIKPDAHHYTEKLALLHQMLVYAMKTKQSDDPANISKLKQLVMDFDKLYFAPH